ncbi:hypothetical protein R3W88_033942 [Solanum pinnatisectum]|uniref:SRR1-like domain-containing protein n=1 Tax=Solanum pinnatisectum TaxID=50273 RepID=A0AAV9K176_9SOLN|nr:hypothetical protein R3W88_033942 [Solanum pinnatisectum]
MASSAKTPALDKPNPAEDWTAVLPRLIIHERQKQEQLWTPADIETNPERESKLMQKIQTCIRKLENSSFYIESYEPPRLQLSLSIILKRMFSWIGQVEVFDLVFSLAESRLLTALDSLRPTMFFTPHCDAELYENLLEANWRHDLLSNMTLFGNSFEAYEQHMSEKHILAIMQFLKELPIDSRKHIVPIRRFVKEHSIDPFSDDLFCAFHGSSWHFFDIDPHADLCDAKL